MINSIMSTHIKLTLVENKDEPKWSNERFSATSDLSPFEVTGNDPDEVLNCLKGVMLCAIGQRKVIPDNVNISFELIKKQI